jgi:5-methylcytosine-specific restriction endonuclease McrA
MMVPPRRCAGCRALITGVCATCSTQRERRRQHDPHRPPYKTERWKRYSRRWLSEHPFCGERQDGQRHPEHSLCTRERRLIVADCTDHIIPTAKGGDHWQPANHQSLCRRCNSLKGDRLGPIPGGGVHVPGPAKSPDHGLRKDLHGHNPNLEPL